MMRRWRRLSLTYRCWSGRCSRSPGRCRATPLTGRLHTSPVDADGAAKDDPAGEPGEGSGAAGWPESSGYDPKPGEDQSAEPGPPPGPGPAAGSLRLPPELSRRFRRQAAEALRYSGAADRAWEALRNAGSAASGREALQRLPAYRSPALDSIAQRLVNYRSPALDSMVEQVRRQVALPVLQFPQWQQALQRLGTSLARYWPDNWEDLGAADIAAVLAIAQQDGLALVWVPRSGLVTELLAAADGDARRALLGEHVEEVVADCGAVVAHVDHPRLREYQDRLGQAVAAHQAGLHAAGQALDAAVITALLQWVYGHVELKKVRKSPMRAKDAEEQLLRDLKVAVLIEAAVPATAGGMDKLGDDELPDRFNRHATLHRVADRAYTVPNALSALMLATGLLAEAQQLLQDGRLPQ